MTKVQNPIIGRSRGSAGGMTFSKVYNKNVMRAKAFEVANPKTAAQVEQRNFFKQVSAIVANLSPTQLRTLFPTMPKGISRRNAFFKQIAGTAAIVDNVKVAKLHDLATVGNAPVMDFGTTTCSISSGTISVGLDNAVKAITALANNRFTALIVNETKGDIHLPVTNNKVETGTLSITAPSNWENSDTLHAIPLITDATAEYTSYGTIAVATRPERQGE